MILERPHARMGDGLAAARLEFRRRAERYRQRCPLDQQTTCACKKGQAGAARVYEPIEGPKNSATGFVSAFFAVVIGFAMIWHIWWMAGLGVFGAFVTLLAFAFRRQERN